MWSVFGSSGFEQLFTVPAGVTSLHVVAVGGRGGAGTGPMGDGGFGAVASADVAVMPRQQLYVEVGGNGGASDPLAPNTPGAAGGFNGGASGGAAAVSVPGAGDFAGGGGGGGASDVRTVPLSVAGSLTSRLITAGGGGGGGGFLTCPACNFPKAGGAAGMDGQAANPSSVPAGHGAQPSQPGAGGGDGHPGMFGTGGSGGAAVSDLNGGGGGGGAGVDGGGGGGGCSPPSCTGGGAPGAGGGGGSSGFSAAARNASVGADPTGAPSVTITYAPSNVFLLPRPAIGKHGRLMFSFNAPGAGVFRAVARTGVTVVLQAREAKKKRTKVRKFTYGSASATAFGAGVVRLTIAPSVAASKVLRTGKRLAVSVAVTFTPFGGTPKTETISINVKTKKGGRKH